MPTDWSTGSWVIGHDDRSATGAPVAKTVFYGLILLAIAAYTPPAAPALVAPEPGSTAP